MLVLLVSSQTIVIRARRIVLIRHFRAELRCPFILAKPLMGLRICRIVSHAKMGLFRNFVFFDRINRDHIFRPSSEHGSRPHCQRALSLGSATRRKTQPTASSGPQADLRRVGALDATKAAHSALRGASLCVGYRVLRSVPWDEAISRRALLGRPQRTRHHSFPTASTPAFRNGLRGSSACGRCFAEMARHRQGQGESCPFPHLRCN